MSAKIIDGKQIAAEIREELKTEVTALKARGVTPGLGVILVGADPASQSYVSAKEKACGNIGIYSDDNRLPAEASQEELLALVNQMNQDPKINTSPIRSRNGLRRCQIDEGRLFEFMGG